jgi:histidine triad (HIT) family protein
MASIFTHIINRQIPAHIVAEDHDFIAFLDIRPLKPGHTLVVPKVEIDHFFDMPSELLSAILPFAKQVAKGLEKAVPCLRVGMAVVGLEIPHAHLHLIPLQEAYDIDFTKQPPVCDSSYLAGMAQTIRAAIETL